jgi:hypothetical protein
MMERAAMEGIKAKIEGEGLETSVEFSVEEVIARHHGAPWSDLSEAEREDEMKDYALLLFTRQSGMRGDLRVSLVGGSFARTQGRNV